MHRTWGCFCSWSMVLAFAASTVAIANQPDQRGQVRVADPYRVEVGPIRRDLRTGEFVRRFVLPDAGDAGRGMTLRVSNGRDPVRSDRQVVKQPDGAWGALFRYPSLGEARAHSVITVISGD